MQVKENLSNPGNGYWRIEGLVLDRPRQNLNCRVKSFHLEKEVCNTLPLAVGCAISAVEIQA